MKLWVPPTKREQRLKKMRKTREVALNKEYYDSIAEYCQYCKKWKDVPVVTTNLFEDNSESKPISTDMIEPIGFDRSSSVVWAYF